MATLCLRNDIDYDYAGTLSDVNKVYIPLKECDGTYGWDKMTVKYVISHKSKIVAITNRQISNMEDSYDLYQKLLLEMYKIEDFNIAKVRNISEEDTIETCIERYVINRLKYLIKTYKSETMNIRINEEDNTVIDSNNKEISILDCIPDYTHAPKYVSLRDNIETIYNSSDSDEKIMAMYVFAKCYDKMQSAGIYKILATITSDSSIKRRVVKLIGNPETMKLIIDIQAEGEDGLNTIGRFVKGRKQIDRCIDMIMTKYAKE